MTVYHGTSRWGAEAILTDGPKFERRPHGGRRPFFCVTEDFEVARTFAARRTSVVDFEAGRLTGEVLEFELHGDDWDRVRDRRALRDEGEIAVYQTSSIRAVARWRFEGAKMVRCDIGVSG